MATALETASLVMVPSGYEDGTLGSLQPLDGTGDFTFTRGSNISATRVNEDGYIEKGYDNLLLQSNTFNTTWEQASLNTPISGQAGYDGTSDAWLIESQVAFGQLYQNVSTSGVVSYSVYAKAGTCTSVNLQINATFSVTGFFFLTGEGTSSASSTQVISTSIQRIGTSDWYRCAITYNNSAITRIRILPSDEGGSPIVGTLYIQDAQLNQGLVAYPYLETTTTTAKGGILEDMPRLNYSSGRCSLLLEPSRTNLITSSEYYDSWQKQNVTIENNSIASPENKINAAKLTGGGPTGQRRISQSFNQVSGLDFTTSIFAKRDTEDILFLRLYNTTDSVYAIASFNLSTGIIDSNDSGLAKIEDWGNGWYRCILKGVPSTTTLSGGVYFNLETSGNNDSTSSLYLWGAQLEQASYLTSYIPTYGVSQTRLGDGAANSNVVNADDDFTLYFESTRMDYGFTGVYFQATNFGYLSGYTISNTNLRFRYSNVNYGFTASEGVFKYLIRKDSTDMRIYFNGALEYTITTLPTGIGNLNLSGGKIHKTMVFPTALSDEVCIELTTP